MRQGPSWQQLWKRLRVERQRTAAAPARQGLGRLRPLCDTAAFLMIKFEQIRGCIYSEILIKSTGFAIWGCICPPRNNTASPIGVGASAIGHTVVWAYIPLPHRETSSILPHSDPDAFVFAENLVDA